MNHLINYCTMALTPVLVVIGSTATANVNYCDDKDGSGWVIHGQENSTAPGGFRRWLSRPGRQTLKQLNEPQKNTPVNA